MARWPARSLNAHDAALEVQEIRLDALTFERRFAANDPRAGVQAARRERLKEDPETLLDVARRARSLADVLSNPERSRILDYVRDLEEEATAWHGGRFALVGAAGLSGDRLIDTLIARSMAAGRRRSRVCGSTRYHSRAARDRRRQPRPAPAGLRDGHRRALSAPREPGRRGADREVPGRRVGSPGHACSLGTVSDHNRNIERGPSTFPEARR